MGAFPAWGEALRPRSVLRGAVRGGLIALLANCGGEDLRLPTGGSENPEPSGTRSTLEAQPQSIMAGVGVATIRVTVRSDSGEPIEGVGVRLSASGGDNTLVQPTGTTGPDGLAIGTITSNEPGTLRVSALLNGTVELADTAEVSVQPVGGSAALIAPLDGDDQRAPAGSNVPVRPAVLVTDDLGLPVEGFPVRFVVTRGGGTVEGADQSTDAQGIARPDEWRLGDSPGTNTLEARAGSLQGSPVVFTAEGLPSEASVDRLVFTIPPRDVRVDEMFRIEVALVDKNGDVVPLSGVFIYIDLFREGQDVASNPLFQGERFENTEDGFAAFDIKVLKKGSYRLRALTDDLPSLGPHGPEPYLFSQTFKVR